MSNTGENIYERRDGRWEGRYICGRKPDGRARYISVYGRSRTEVQTKMQEQLQTSASNSEPPGIGQSDLTVNQLFELFLKRATVKRSTYARYKAVIDLHILPRLGKRRVCTLTAKELSAYLWEKRRHGNLRTGGALSEKSVRDLAVLIKSALRFARRELHVYCNAEQPARFDTGKKTFTYRNENDDDTFHASFSYDRYEDAFLILTFQISEQRTHRVAAETHITPKTISWLSKDFQTVTPVFFTEDFEINLTRRLDKNHILMTTEPYMTGKRTLKMLDIETQEVTDVDIPGILQVYMFYPARDENTIFLIGQNTLPSWQLYRYELDTQTLKQVEFPETPRQIVDLQLTYQTSSSD